MLGMPACMPGSGQVLVQQAAYASPVLDLALQGERLQLCSSVCQRGLLEEAVVARVEAVQVLRSGDGLLSCAPCRVAAKTCEWKDTDPVTLACEATAA